jgi:hypothetical protein
MLRRRRTTPEVQAAFEAFRDVLVHLEPAKAALTDVMPTTRMPGRPLPDALAEFEVGLARSGNACPRGGRRRWNRSGRRASKGWWTR